MFFFGEKQIFSPKNSSIYVECIFGKSDEKFMPQIYKNSSSFFEIKHTNNFSSPLKVYFSEEIVWMRGMTNLKAGQKTFFEKSPKFHSTKIRQFLFENSFCLKKSVSLKRYIEQLECNFDNRTELFLRHSENKWIKTFSKKRNNSSGSKDWKFHNSEDKLFGKTKSRNLLLGFWKKKLFAE